MDAELSAAQHASLRLFLDELQRWNTNHHLTAVPPSDFWTRHVEEALGLLAVAAPHPAARVVDIGSGFGVPGVVIAVARPDLQVALLEADTRKAGFLVHIAGLLELRNVTVLTLRAEHAGHRKEHRAAFDIAISRATAPPTTLCELALPLLRLGGALWALVADPEAAAAASVEAARACGGGEPHATHTARGDGIFVVDKVAATAERFPRRPGIPSRHPLGRVE